MPSPLVLLDIARRNLTRVRAPMRSDSRPRVRAVGEGLTPLVNRLAEVTAMESARVDLHAEDDDMPPSPAVVDVLSATLEARVEIEVALRRLGVDQKEIDGWLREWERLEVPPLEAPRNAARGSLTLEQALVDLEVFAKDARAGQGADALLEAAARVAALAPGSVEVALEPSWEWTSFTLVVEGEGEPLSLVVCAAIDEILAPYDREPKLIEPLVRVEGADPARVTFRKLAIDERTTARPPGPTATGTLKVAAPKVPSDARGTGPNELPAHLKPKKLPPKPIPRDE